MIVGTLIIVQAAPDRVDVSFKTFRDGRETPREIEHEDAIGKAILAEIEKSQKRNPDIYRTNIVDRSKL
jgi:hypothetical protein